MAKIRLRLKELMKERGINQVQLSKELDIAINTLVSYRNNWIQRPDLDIIAKLCVYFGVNIQDLMVLQTEETFGGKETNEEELSPD